MAEKGSIKSYRDLLVWQKGMALAAQIYRLSRSFPNEERFGLAMQMRRAAVSVPSNIAEGQARHGKKEFAHSLSLAEGSLAELDTQVELSEKLGYCSNAGWKEASAVIVELQKMLNTLRQKLSANLAADGQSMVADRPALAAGHQPPGTKH